MSALVGIAALFLSLTQFFVRKTYSEWKPGMETRSVQVIVGTSKK